MIMGKIQWERVQFLKGVFRLQLSEIASWKMVLKMITRIVLPAGDVRLYRNITVNEGM